MARKRNRDAAPSAPAEVSPRKARIWSALGRRDAKRYGSLLDFTPTHSLLRAEGEAQRGQHNVNTWLLEKVAPEQTGNERIMVQMRKALSERSSLIGQSTSSARAQSLITVQMEQLDQKLANMEAQWRSNVSKARTASKTAEQALGTWEKYYAQVAAIYTRARTNARGQSASSVAAEVPMMRSIPLVEIEGFDSDQPPVTTGGRK